MNFLNFFHYLKEGGGDFYHEPFKISKQEKTKINGPKVKFSNVTGTQPRGNKEHYPPQKNGNLFKDDSSFLLL